MMLATNFLKFLLPLSLLIVVDASPPEINLLTWIGADTHGAPQEILKTSISHDLDDEAPVTLVNSSTYILTSEVTLVAFMCKANYPIEWEFSNSKWILLQEKTFGMYLTTSRRSAPDINNPSTFTYFTELAIIGDSRMFNGRFICKNAQQTSKSSAQRGLKLDEGKSASILLYWEGGLYNSIFPLAGNIISIFVETFGKTDRVIFPCFVNNPSVQVFLKKEILTENNDTWVPYNSDNLKYEPGTGFIYDSKGLIDYPDGGSYKCTTEDEEDENNVMYLNFTPSPEPNVALNLPITSNAVLTLDRWAYKCCSGSEKAPLLIVHSCSSPTTCKEVITAIKTQQNSVQLKQRHLTSMNKLYIPQWEMLLNSRNKSCSSYRRYYSQYDMDIVQCIGDGITTLKKFIPDIRQSFSYEEWESNANLEDFVKIHSEMENEYVVETDRSGNYQVYSGSTVSFTCQSTFYYFSHGIRFSSKNGMGEERIYPDTFEKDTKATMGMLILLHNPPLKAVVNVSITSEIKSLTCHLPLTSSSKWVNKTIHFHVKEAEKPWFSPKDGLLNENIVWELNSTDNLLTCHVNGDPEPKVVWLKDGQPIGNHFNVSRHNNLYSLQVPKATHEFHGEYRCVAVSFAGKSEKVFNVFIQETSGGHAIIIVLAGTFIILALLGLVYLIWKGLLQRKSLENLRGNVFPQEGT